MKLAITGLCKDYDFRVFDDLNISFESNLTHLVGKNGSGKSTLLKVISNKERIKRGKFYIDGKRVSRNYLQEKCVLVDQNINLFLNYTVYWNIKKIVHKVDFNLIDEFGFKDLLNKRVEELSGGWKKKLMLLIAFIIKPQILLLDEYSNYLDIDFVNMINKKIIEYSKDHLVIYIDHNQDIGGEIKDISSVNDFIDLKGSFKKGIFAIVKPSFRLFDFISFTLILILVCFTQIFYTASDTTANEIMGAYYAKNNLWFQMMYSDADIDNNIFHATFIEYDKRSYSYYLYVDEVFFPLAKESDKTDDNICYVFETYDDLYETYVEVDETQYFVKGIIDLDVDKYVDRELSYCFYSLVFVGTNEYENRKFTMLYGDDLIKAAKNNFLVYTSKPQYQNDAKYWIAFQVILIIFIGTYTIFSSIKNKLEYEVFGSYSKSKIRFILSHFYKVFIFDIIISLAAYKISYLKLIDYFKNNLDTAGYDMSFIRPYKMIIITFGIIIISYVVSNVLIKFIKNNNRL